MTGGVVYALTGASSSYRMQALSSAQGRPLWSQPADWSDQPVLADSDTVCLVSQASDTVWVWTATGRHRWTSDAGVGIISAAVAPGAVYAITKDGRLLALEAASGRRIWQQAASAAIKPVVASGVVYAGSADGGIVARRTGDGSQLWKSAVRFLTAGPAVAGDLLYAAGAGQAVALRA